MHCWDLHRIDLNALVDWEHCILVDWEHCLFRHFIWRMGPPSDTSAWWMLSAWTLKVFLFSLSHTQIHTLSLQFSLYLPPSSIPLSPSLPILPSILLFPRVSRFANLLFVNAFADMNYGGDIDLALQEIIASQQRSQSSNSTPSCSSGPN